MNEEKDHHFYHYILFFFIITIFFFVFRLIIYFFDLPHQFEFSKDMDFRIFHKGFQNGLICFYKPVSGYVWRPYYLYFWYFIFYPLGIIPIEIGVYIWDILRFILIVFITIKVLKMSKNKIDKVIFKILVIIGYCIDGWFNNSNFIILFFLYQSYVFLENGNKWGFGLFFALAIFKINVILFLPILLIMKKIKIRDLFYFLVPFLLICIPYIAFPDYFMQMINNWLFTNVEIQNLTIFDAILLTALQPGHILFISLFYIILFENIPNSKRKNKIRLLTLITIIIYYAYFGFIALKI